jgi:hypothetical protein
MDDVAGCADGLEAPRRRSDRFSLLVPIEVKWREPGGNVTREQAQAKAANSHGGLLDMKTYPPVGTEVELENPVSAEAILARVVAVRRSNQGLVIGVGVEFVVPSDTFWGITFQLRRTSAQLLKLEQVIRTGDIDPFVLREFRDAVDHIRKTAWVVQEWHERRLQHRDAQTVLSLLTAERMRRATQLNDELATDLEARELTHGNEAIADLLRAVQRLHRRVAKLIKKQETA